MSRLIIGSGRGLWSWVTADAGAAFSVVPFRVSVGDGGNGSNDLAPAASDPDSDDIADNSCPSASADVGTTVGGSVGVGASASPFSTGLDDPFSQRFVCVGDAFAL